MTGVQNSQLLRLIERVVIAWEKYVEVVTVPKVEWNVMPTDTRPLCDACFGTGTNLNGWCGKCCGSGHMNG